jgi:hypothetical protein
METPQLLTMLEKLLGRLKRGDREALSTVRKLKVGAKSGVRAAELAFNTLAALYWERNSPTWKRAEAFYEKLLKDDRKAWERVKDIHRRTHEQDEVAARGLAMLKAIHNHRKRSVWYPGAPQIGHYPMPTQHRPGIMIGNWPSSDIIGNWPPDDIIGGIYDSGLPAIDPNLLNLLNQIPGMLPPTPAPSPFPGLPGWPQIPGLPSIPGLPGYPPPLPPGIPPAFIPLSQQAATGLLQLISQARQSVPVGGRDPNMMMSSLAPDEGAPSDTTATSTVMSTVPMPTTLSTTMSAQQAARRRRQIAPVQALGKKGARAIDPNAPVQALATSSAQLYEELQKAIQNRRGPAAIAAITARYNAAKAAGR